MTHGPTRIATKGACIYCGRSDVKLTDEHIVPLSLGGFHIIEKASCEQCAKITTRFERDVGRELWGDARIAYNAPSRRRRERQTHINLPPGTSSSSALRVAYNEYPAPMIFYQMHKAGLLQGLPGYVDISAMWKLIAVTAGKKLQAFEAKRPGKLTGKFRHVPQSFGRLVAKIGYGQLLTSLDPGDFQAICLPYILGEDDNISFIVGGRFATTPPEKDFGYVLKTAGFGSTERVMLVAEVRLIANASTPTYHVIVGDVTGRDRVEAVIVKLKAADAIHLLPFQLDNPDPSSENEHWSPAVWPLPFWAQR